MRILGVDFGKKKFGLAVSTGKIALPFAVVDNTKGVISKIKKICQEEEIGRIIVGLPLNLDGTEGRMVKKVRSFGRKLEQNLGLKVDFWDERLTTEVAKQKVGGRRPEDAEAASIMLQSYLDSKW